MDWITEQCRDRPVTREIAREILERGHTSGKLHSKVTEEAVRSHMRSRRDHLDEVRRAEVHRDSGGASSSGAGPPPSASGSKAAGAGPPPSASSSRPGPKATTSAKCAVAGTQPLRKATAMKSPPLVQPKFPARTATSKAKSKAGWSDAAKALAKVRAGKAAKPIDID